MLFTNFSFFDFHIDRIKEFEAVLNEVVIDIDKLRRLCFNGK